MIGWIVLSVLGAAMTNPPPPATPGRGVGVLKGSLRRGVLARPLNPYLVYAKKIVHFATLLRQGVIPDLFCFTFMCISVQRKLSV